MAVAPALEPVPPESALERGRRRLLLACAYDAGTLLVALFGSSAVATAWMLSRSDWGRVDLGAPDADLALAISISAGPAWTAWQWLHVWSEGGTFGVRRAMSGSPQPASASPVRRVVWLALHPVSIPFWGWATSIFIATGTPAFMAAGLLPATLGLLAALLAIASFVMLLVRPLLSPLHTWIAVASFGGRR